MSQTGQKSPTHDVSKNLSATQSAEWLGVSLRTLARMRQDGTGPHFVMVGRRVLYPLTELRDYIALQTFSNTAEVKIARRGQEPRCEEAKRRDS